ncbi:Asp-tRNA(Asn)/Glu-tRNA(Gln) amidotransferase subunit GatB [Candidatus Berkelbacteria bacterium]|nr:Asp-tRNA(Asn)/Glu-tRNA(Gln) amidotransferase subunit GatB [Candidatus Berkelbacteria bacterium]
MSKYQSTIGLEIHAETKTKSKLFCACKNDPFHLGSSVWARAQPRPTFARRVVRRPNIYICPVCLGLPGSLPVLNRKAVEETIKLGLALNCKINPQAKWDRKNYFYPDLPKGYQISQYDLPLCQSGYFEMSNVKAQMSNEIQNPRLRQGYGGQAKSKKIRIRRIHLEEDTGKLIHPTGANYSLVDFNRAGVPLLELVTEPDITSAEQAKEFAQEIQRIFRKLGVSDADMEKGQMRVEANISLLNHQPSTSTQKGRGFDHGVGAINHQQKLGTKVEIKNLNSFRSVERAINYEIGRQTEILEKGGKVSHETRGFDEKNQRTFSQRSKEEAPDYRYFAEPDLLPLQIKGALKDVKKEMPSLSGLQPQTLISEYHLAFREAELLIKKGLLDLFKATLQIGGQAKTVANLLINQAQTRELKPVDILRLIKKREGKKGKVSAFLINKVLDRNQKAVLDYQKGKENALQFLVGEVMREMKGKVDARSVRRHLLEKLKKY